MREPRIRSAVFRTWEYFGMCVPPASNCAIGIMGGWGGEGGGSKYISRIRCPLPMLLGCNCRSQWASLSQKDSALWAPCCGGPTFVEPAERDQAQVLAADRYEASRTEEEKAGFHFALHETMDLWYSSMRTRAPQSTC
eukprot:5780811-Prymnesium_polylepis.1